MIQRIQTVFLLVAFLGGVLLFFFPLAGIYGDTSTYIFYIYQFRNMVPGEPSLFNNMAVIPLALINAGMVALAAVSIFMYKNRLRQMRLVRFAIFLGIILIALIFFVYAGIIERTLGIAPDYMSEAGIYFPLVSLVFLILANRYIVRDERMVRSIDRLR
jgi:small neutral amino acid transporter SnatA (MarC family)